MQIHLNETELKQAIAEYINHQGIDLSDRSVEITFTAGRGNRGHYADIDLLPKEPDTSPFEETEISVDEEDKGIDFG